MALRGADRINLPIGILITFGKFAGSCFSFSDGERFEVALMLKDALMEKGREKKVEDGKTARDKQLGVLSVTDNTFKQEEPMGRGRDKVRPGSHALEGFSPRYPQATACFPPSPCGIAPQSCAGPHRNSPAIRLGHTGPLRTSQDTPGAVRQSSPTWAALSSVRPTAQPFGQPQGFYRRPAPARSTRGKNAPGAHRGFPAAGHNGEDPAQDRRPPPPQGRTP